MMNAWAEYRVADPEPGRPPGQQVGQLDRVVEVQRVRGGRAGGVLGAPQRLASHAGDLAQVGFDLADLRLGPAGGGFPRDLLGVGADSRRIGLNHLLEIGRQLLFASGLPVAFERVGGDVVDLLAEGDQPLQGAGSLQASPAGRLREVGPRLPGADRAPDESRA
jgi:hypothetical protein